jgi:MoxR-like ATPase
MNANRKYEFVGDGRDPLRRHADAPQTPEPYIASKQLVRAVNLAIHLERPLLLEGEAGCGKTRLARAVAWELGLPFYPWYVNSRTRVEEGLYSFDAIGRLYDVHLSKELAQSEGRASRRNPDNPDEYLRYGPLARAFNVGEDWTAVVLIDEIDKANLDFSNDLLTTLDDEYKFTIPETGATIRPERKPIIFITSNREKGDLPEPFLRRCIYFFVDFPGEDGLKNIVRKHYKCRDEETPSSKLINAATARFIAARKKARAKRPGTSEFLDWMKALHRFEAKPYSPGKLVEDGALPYREALFKNKEDWEER